jgi:serine/threonine protein phosphatase PrpC
VRGWPLEETPSVVVTVSLEQGPPSRCITDAGQRARAMQRLSVMTRAVHLSIAGRSDIGRSRKNNEDALIIADVAGGSLLRGDAPRTRIDVGEQGVLLAVSDGVGGHRAGEVASAVTVEALARAMVDASPHAPAEARIEDAVQSANLEVVQASRRRGREGMGATLTAVLVQARGDAATAFIAEVGDSRAYLVRSGHITGLTKDQSYVQLLLDAGALDEKEAAESPLHNVILQAMGQRDGVHAALGKLKLRRRDCLLLTSDGLTNAVSDDEIRGVVLGSPDLGEACTRLVGLANERGGKDNITVLAAGVGGDLAAPAAGETADHTFEVLASFEPPKVQ